MKKTFFHLFILLLLFRSTSFAQLSNQISKILREEFDNFNYQSVINKADSILNSSFQLTKDDSLQILFYKSISAFYLWDIDLCEKTFYLILQIDPAFKMDSSFVSPKIIRFFEEAKSKYIMNNNATLKQNFDISSFQEQIRKQQEQVLTRYKNGLYKNLFIPGFGFIHQNEKNKGYIYSGIFFISMISSIYFYFDTNKKEKNYIDEINVDRIPEKYNAYNFSFKARNISISIFILSYLTSQIDYLISNFPSIQFSAATTNSQLNFSNFTFTLSFTF